MLTSDLAMSRVRAGRVEPLAENPADKNYLEMAGDLIAIFAEHTGQPAEQILEDLDRDRFMTPDEAKEYGLIDQVLERRL